jgi:formylglycine-generating enzyme required for sulfatase activity
MRKILCVAGFFIAALMARATDGANSVTIGGQHLVNITAVVKISPTMVMIRSDGQLMQVEIKALPEQFLGTWNISTMESALNYEPGRNHTVTLPDAVTLDLIWIDPGTFTMGSPDDEAGRNTNKRTQISETSHGGEEGPQTVVTISKGFWLGRTPVTQGQYHAIMYNNPGDSTNGGPDVSVRQVTWDEAMAFCQKLTELERAAGHMPEGYAYTLPTEAQWEYACRAGTTESRYDSLHDIAWYVGSARHPVAQKPPNAWGLYDMLGNGWEWCSDLYGVYPGGNVTDPVGADPATTIYGPSGPVRVTRGGGPSGSVESCRSACRQWYLPDERFAAIGFRVVLSSAPSGKAVPLANPTDVAATAEELDRISGIPADQPPWYNQTRDLGGEESPDEPGDYIRIEKDRVPGFAQVVPSYSSLIVFASRGHCLRILQTYSAEDGRWFRVTSAYGNLSGLENGSAWIHESAGSVFTRKPRSYLKLEIGLLLMLVIGGFLQVTLSKYFFR